MFTLKPCSAGKMKCSFNLLVIITIHCFTLIFTVMDTVLHHTHTHTSAKEINKDRFSPCWPTHSAHVPVVSLCGFSTVALTGGSSAGVKERKQEDFAVCYQLFVTPTANYSTQPEQLPHHGGGKRSCCTCRGARRA